MKTKVITLLVMLGCVTSCDMSYPLLADGLLERRVSCDCGSVVLKGASALSDWIELSLDGNFMVMSDSLDINYPRKSTDIYLNDSLIDNSQPLLINGKNKIGIRLSADLPLHWGRTGRIQLLPSSFILCDGKPIIKDTINFTCKSKK